jgi:hypothetical protein
MPCSQATRDGSLAFLVRKARTQPQIYTAYTSTAPMRSKEQTSEFEASIAALQVWANASHMPLKHEAHTLHDVLHFLTPICAGLCPICRTGSDQDGSGARSGACSTHPGDRIKGCSTCSTMLPTGAPCSRESRGCAGSCTEWVACSRLRAEPDVGCQMVPPAAGPRQSWQ